MVKNLIRLINKAGFGIFMFALVGGAIGLAKGVMPVVYVCGAIVLVGAVMVLVRANRSVSGKPRPRVTTGDGTPVPKRPSTSSSRRSSISDPDRY